MYSFIHTHFSWWDIRTHSLETFSIISVTIVVFSSTKPLSTGCKHCMAKFCVCSEIWKIEINEGNSSLQMTLLSLNVLLISDNWKLLVANDLKNPVRTVEIINFKSNTSACSKLPDYPFNGRVFFHFALPFYEPFTLYQAALFRPYLTRLFFGWYKSVLKIRPAHFLNFGWIIVGA